MVLNRNIKWTMSLLFYPPTLFQIIVLVIWSPNIFYTYSMWAVYTLIGLVHQTSCFFIWHWWTWRNQSCLSENPQLLIVDSTALTYHQTRNQFGAPGGAKSFPRRAQIFCTMPNTFKLCPTHFSRGAKMFLGGGLRPLRLPWLGPVYHLFSNFHIRFCDFHVPLAANNTQTHVWNTHLTHYLIHDTSASVVKTPCAPTT